MERTAARVSYAGASKDISRLPAADGLGHDPDAVAMRAFRTADLQAGGGHPPTMPSTAGPRGTGQPGQCPTRTVTAFINAFLPQQPE